MCKTNVLCQKPRTKETDKPNRNLSVDHNDAKKICGKEYVSISVSMTAALSTMG